MSGILPRDHRPRILAVKPPTRDPCGDEDLGRAEDWQREQAWATWERIAAGDVREVSIERIREDTRKALARMKAKKRR